jgi:hypothetical protein
MHEYQNFSSMQPEIERHFVPFERRTVEDTKKAWVIGLGSAGGVLLISLILVLSFEKPEPLHADALDTDVPAERRAPRPAATPPPAPAPTEAPAEAEPAETEPAGEAGEPAGGEGEEGAAPSEEAAAPPPPRGATKAPPSALVGQ